MKQILLMHGPNLNMLGRREPGIYGSMTLDAIEEALRRQAKDLGVELHCFQSNHEDRLARRLSELPREIRGVILNAGAYTHTGEVLAQAVARCAVPVVEVHISNVFAREPFRHRSLLTPHCAGVICGLGLAGYACALGYLAR